MSGCFSSLMSKVSKVNAAHGPFSALLCVGQFFRSDNASETADELLPYLNEEKQIPVPTYFIAGDESEASSSIIDQHPNGGQLCPNLIYLGRSGVRKIGGLSVSYLSGIYDADRYFDLNQQDRLNRYESHYIEDDVLALSRAAAGEQIDLLLTTEWGKNWHTLIPDNKLPQSLLARLVDPAIIRHIGSPVIARLATQLPVRYHFAAQQDAYFELPPYKNNTYYTRFFALGAHGSKRKEKSLYACNIAPNFILDPSTIPVDVTPCPYTVPTNTSKVSSRDRERPQLEQPGSNKRVRLAGFVPAAMTTIAAEPTEEAINSIRWDTTPLPRRPPPSTYICNICHHPGHWIQDCPQKQIPSTPTDPNIPPEGYLCKKCQQPGHYIRHCPLLEAENVAKQNGQPPADYICNKCHQPGHFIRDCPLIIQENQQRQQQQHIPPEGYKCNKCGSSAHYIRDCPIVDQEKKLKDEGLPPADYKCRKCGQHHWIQKCPLIKAEEAERTATTSAKQKDQSHKENGINGITADTESSSCWFCLATTNVAAHLIVSVGDECYVALAKGPLVDGQAHHILSCINPALHHTILQDILLL